VAGVVGSFVVWGPPAGISAVGDVVKAPTASPTF